MKLTPPPPPPPNTKKTDHMLRAGLTPPVDPTYCYVCPIIYIILRKTERHWQSSQGHCLSVFPWTTCSVIRSKVALRNKCTSLNVFSTCMPLYTLEKLLKLLDNSGRPACRTLYRNHQPHPRQRPFCGITTCIIKAASTSSVANMDRMGASKRDTATTVPFLRDVLHIWLPMTSLVIDMNKICGGQSGLSVL